MRAIAAITKDWGLGYQGKLLVSNSEDLKHFKRLTSGGTVVMGKNTYLSLPRAPLPGRRNIVLVPETEAQDIVQPNEYPNNTTLELAHSKDEVLALIAQKDAEDDAPYDAWSIGGGMIYRLFLDECSEVHLTLHHTLRPADTFFPRLDEDNAWYVSERTPGGVTDEGIAYEYVTYRRKN